jgi:hypothetical protein
MKYIVLWAGLLLSCQAEKEFEGTYTDFEDVNFVTLTNESTDGGSQIAYLKKMAIQPTKPVFVFAIRVARETQWKLLNYSSMKEPRNSATKYILLTVGPSKVQRIGVQNTIKSQWV